MTTYRQLYEKYGYFESPALSLTLDGFALHGQEDFTLGDVRLTLSSTLSANLVHAAITRVTGAQRLSRALQLGAKVELKLGYGKALTPLFTGCLYTADAASEGAEALTIQLAALDCKGLMMLGARTEYPPGKKLSQLVRDILNQPSYKAFAPKSKISPIGAAMDVPVLLEGESDYAFLSFWAERLGYEFYYLADSAYFVKARENTAPLLTLRVGEGLRVLRAHATLAGQAASCTAGGYDGIGKRAEATVKAARSKRFAGNKLSGVVKNTVSLALPEIESAAQAKILAGAHMDRITRGQLTVEGSLTGLPELVPARVVTLEDPAGLLSGNYYVTEVRHRMDAGGFVTDFEAYAV